MRPKKVEEKQQNKLLDKSEIASLIYLLDDTDAEVVDHVSSKLLSFGNQLIPIIEENWDLLDSIVKQERVENLIKQIQSQSLESELLFWTKSEQKDLLQGLLLIDRFHNPNSDISKINQMLDKIRLDVWLELREDLTSFEKVKILNYVFYDVHKFKGNTEDYHNPNNSFISEVLEKKSGNPILMACVYSIVAQKLNIPIHGINLPQHFILGYVKPEIEKPHQKAKYNTPYSLKENPGQEAMFFINPFNKGLIFSKENVQSFLKQLKIETRENFYQTCSHAEILKRVLRNLIFSYEKQGELAKAEQLLNLKGILDKNTKT